MSDDVQRNNEFQSWRVLRGMLWLIALAALLLDEYRGQQWSHSTSDYVFMAIGFCIIGATVLDLRIGNSSLAFVDYDRSESPARFWMCVAVLAGIGCFFMIGALGELLGFWNLA
jgi:hypothetical protein